MVPRVSPIDGPSADKKAARMASPEENAPGRPAQPEGAQSNAEPGGEKTPQDSDLTRRIEAARRALEPERGPNAADKYNQLTIAWRMTLELVVGSAFGFGIGWGLDSLLGTKPLFLIVFGLLGFAAGVKLVYETAQTASKSGEDREGGGAGRSDDGPRG